MLTLYNLKISVDFKEHSTVNVYFLIVVTERILDSTVTDYLFIGARGMRRERQKEG